METKWSDIGFLGSLLFVLYGIISLLIFFMPPSFFGSFAPFTTGILAVLGIIAGTCFSLGFHGLRIELAEPSAWFSYFTILYTISIWLFTGISQILIALGLVIGIISWFYSIFGIMIMFIIWGMFFFLIRKQLGDKGRFAFGASVLFLINGLTWLSFIGLGVVALAAFLCLFIYAPERKFSFFSPLVRFLSQKRLSLLRDWGPFLLIIYSVLGMKWLVNGVYPLPVSAVLVINILSLFIGCFTIVGITWIFRVYEREYENSNLWFAQLAWIPGFLLLLMADLQWLMSNLTVFIDPLWGINLYQTLIFYVWWSSIPLTIFLFITALSFMQLYRLPELRGRLLFLLLHLAFLITAFLWLTISATVSGFLPYIQWIFSSLNLPLLSIFSLGHIGLLVIGILLWRLGAQES